MEGRPTPCKFSVLGSHSGGAGHWGGQGSGGSGRDLRQGPGGPDITGAGVGRHTQDIETYVSANPTLLVVKDRWHSQLGLHLIRHVILNNQSWASSHFARGIGS